MTQKAHTFNHWSEAVHQLFRDYQISLVSFIPDGGLKGLIQLCEQDEQINTVTLTTEEEGVALSAGAFLGGARSVLLMQSSGVGNCINMLSLPAICNMPFVTLITMRGEWGEFNPWQVPMGQATPAALEAMGVIVFRANTADEVGLMTEAAMKLAFDSRQRVAILVSQRTIGIKKF
ncbi:MAG: phosphonopyruvate decarboxylase [Chloroflexota bacterium]